MGLKLEEMGFEDYLSERDAVKKLIGRIWTGHESYGNAIHSIERWVEEEESGKYFYINSGNEKIGITGYWPVTLTEGDFVLRHHGTSIPGTGKQALDLLVEYLAENYGDSFERLMEFIPKGREELIEVFEKWGFELDPNGIPEWQPRRDYYKYSMIRAV